MGHELKVVSFKHTKLLIHENCILSLTHNALTLRDKIRQENCVYNFVSLSVDTSTKNNAISISFELNSVITEL